MNTAALSTPPEPAHCRREIGAHFGGRISPEREAAMRAHLPACAPCRRYYDRHLTLAGLDPRAPSSQQRIAVGLGLRFPARDRGNWTWRRAIAAVGVGVTIPLAAAAVFAFWGNPGNQGSPRADGDFVARGAGTSAGRAPSFWTYRFAAGTAPRLADRTIGAGDELAFAYSNPAGKRYVMIFGVDERRTVYWFHPAWPTGQPAPASVPASAGPGPHELPAAIRHAIAGRRLNVYAVLSDDRLTATTVEARVRDTMGDDAPPVLGDGVVTIRRAFEVGP